MKKIWEDALFFSCLFLHIDISKPTDASIDKGERTAVIGKTDICFALDPKTYCSAST